MGPQLIEHRQTLEKARRWRRDSIVGMVPYDVGRWVCTCGHTTRWHTSARNAEHARDRHALDGQLSADWRGLA